MLPKLILGIGNILMRDDGVGVRVIEELVRRQLPEGVEVMDGGTQGAVLVEQIADRQKVVVVDAVDAEGAPGTIYRFPASNLAEKRHCSVSLHEFGLIETLQMARRLGCEPKEIIVIGIKPKVVSVGLELSEEVSSAVPRAANAALAEMA